MNSSTENPTNPPRSSGPFALLRQLAGPALVLIALVVAGRYAGRFWPDIEAAVGELGFSGYLLFCVAWVILSLTCFPVSVLGVSAGALFGPWLGTALVVPSALVGGSIMFWLGRGLLRARILKMVATRPKLAAIDRLAGEQALKLNFLTRLSPLNYGLASYTLSAGRTSFRAYFAGCFAVFPSALAQVWFGSLAIEAGSGADDGGFSSGKLAILVAGVIFFALLTWMIGRMVKKAWDETEQTQDTGHE